MEPKIFDIEAAATAAGVLAPNVDVLLGRRAGEEVRKHLKLTNLSGSDTIVLVAPRKKTVTPSFFVGLLQGAVNEYSSVDEAREHIVLKNGTGATYTNFQTALTTIIGDKPVTLRPLYKRILGMG